jgi:hypothetical protein
MVQEILESPTALKRNIEFYQKTKGLIQWKTIFKI